MLDPALLTAGLQVVGLGVPPEQLIAAQARSTSTSREIAETYVQMFVDTGWRAFVEAGAPPEELERVQAMVARLQPVAAQALLAAFRTEMAAAVESAVETALSQLAAGDPGAPRAERGLVGLRRGLPGAQAAVADDGTDHEGDQQRGGHEEAERAEDAQAVGGQDVEAAGHLPM